MKKNILKKTDLKKVLGGVNVYDRKLAPVTPKCKGRTCYCNCDNS